MGKGPSAKLSPTCQKPICRRKVVELNFGCYDSHQVAEHELITVILLIFDTKSKLKNPLLFLRFPASGKTRADCYILSGIPNKMKVEKFYRRTGIKPFARNVLLIPQTVLPIVSE